MWSKLTWYKLDNCAHHYQTRAANKRNLKEFSYRTESFKYSLFPFCVSESNRETKGKKNRFSKHKLFKGCHQGQHVTECLEFNYSSVFHGPFIFKSISPTLPNLALICAVLHWKLISLICMLDGIFLYILLLVMT